MTHFGKPLKRLPRFVLDAHHPKLKLGENERPKRFHTVSEETRGVETSTLQTEPDTNPLIYLDGVI